MKKMPVVFIGHGSPMNIVEDNLFVGGWREITGYLPKPKAILCVSAHWYTAGQFVSTQPIPETIYDFYGFPRELYNIRYAAPGAPAVAARVLTLLGETAKADEERGLDHGAWSPLHIMYPKAEIPVFQVSVNRNNTPEQSFRAGQLLQPLREEGVLILGSGNVVHNLQLVNWEMEQEGYPFADAFDQYIKSAVIAKDHEAVLHYENAGKKEQQAFYYRDHFDPLLYCLGAVDAADTVQVYNDSRVLGALSMTSYLWQ